MLKGKLTIPVLYSATTLMAYNIAEEFYNKKHYVWCTSEFNSSKQPPTSNPCTIVKRYLEQITTSDRHANEINRNKAGILSGAKKKFNDGEITKNEYYAIRRMVSVSKYSDFYPALYIIDGKKVAQKLIIANKDEKACNDSVEYKIEDLCEGDFQIIKFVDVLHGIIPIPNERMA